MGLGERCQHPSPRSCISADLRQHQAHKWDYTGEGDTHSRDAGCVRGPSGSSLIQAPAHHIPKASSDQGWICTLKFLSLIPFHNDTLFYLTMGLHTDIYSPVPPNVSVFLDLGKELRAGGRGGVRCCLNAVLGKLSTSSSGRHRQTAPLKKWFSSALEKPLFFYIAFRKMD